MPEIYNPQAWNRYSYVKNRPINFIDSTGNTDEPPPWSNPFTYDTWFLSVRGALKHYIGIEGDVTLYVNMKPLKEKGITGFDEMEGTVNLEFALSVGISKQLKGGIVVGSTEGSLKDQASISVVRLDQQFSTNLAGCTKFYLMCAGAETTYDAKKDYLTSKGVLFGFGAGHDLSINLIEVSDSFAEYYNNYNNVNIKVPYLNEGFKQKAKTTVNKIATQLRKLLPE